MRWKSQCLGKGNGLWSWGMGRVGEAGGVRLDQSCLKVCPGCRTDSPVYVICQWPEFVFP